MKVCIIKFLVVAFLGGWLSATPALHFSIYDTEDPVVLNTKNSYTTYVVDIRNEGFSKLTDLKLTCSIPANMELISVEGPHGQQEISTTMQFKILKVLIPGKKVTYKLKCHATKPGKGIFGATVSCSEIKGQYTRQELTTVVSNIQEYNNAYALHFSGYDTEDPCYVDASDQRNQTTYVLEARNEGLATCKGVVFENIIPSDMTFVKASVKPDGINLKSYFANGKVTFAPVTIEPGAHISYRIECQPHVIGHAKNVATLSVDNTTIICEESTVVKNYVPFLDKGQIVSDLLLIGSSNQFLKHLGFSSQGSVNSTISFPLPYPWKNCKKPHIQFTARATNKNKIEIQLNYYDTSPRSNNAKLIDNQRVTIDQWQPLALTLNQQTTNGQKVVLRLVPTMKQKSPQRVKDLPLSLQNFHLLDIEKQKLLANGSVEGQIVGINIPELGLLEFSLHKFPEASILGILKGNQIAVYSREDWTNPRYKIITSNTIVANGKYWVWVAEKPAIGKWLIIQARSPKK